MTPSELLTLALAEPAAGAASTRGLQAYALLPATLRRIRSRARWALRRAESAEPA